MIKLSLSLVLFVLHVLTFECQPAHTFQAKFCFVNKPHDQYVTTRDAMKPSELHLNKAALCSSTASLLERHL